VEPANPSTALVTVVIGVYNGERYLSEAIESVLAQTHQNLELIVVDDGSTDRSGQIASSYDDPVRCIRQENAGMSAARNRAVPEARGEYLSFLDADDRFPRDKLRNQLAVFEADPELDVVYGHVTEFVSPDVDPAVRQLLRPPEHDVAWPTPNLMLVKRESFLRVGLFSTHLKVGIGMDWYARAEELGLRTAMPPILALERRLHAENNGIRQRESRPVYLQVLKDALDRRRALAADLGAGSQD
jgi:glycosyltransferase involved in cell wall biosynthesis